MVARGRSMNAPTAVIRFRAIRESPLHCGGSNLSTVLVLWGIYIKKCISLVRICLQVRKARNASTKFRKTSESKKTEKSLEISAFLVFSCLHLNQTLIMAGVAGFGPTNAGVKVPCLTAWLHPNILFVICRQSAFANCRSTLYHIRYFMSTFFCSYTHRFSVTVKA